MKNVPNIITCLNLFSGCLACLMAIDGLFTSALIFIIIAAILDFMDGFAARLLGAYSDIGKELDSLADVVSFGLAPGFIVYSFLKISEAAYISNTLPMVAFLIPIFSAIRLAKFNIDTRQTVSFIGLPVPANALFWSSFIPVLYPFISGNEKGIAFLVLGLIIISCLLMVSEIPMFSLKFKNYSWNENKLRYFLIILAIVLVFLFQLLGVSLTICAYILFSLANNSTFFKQNDEQ